VALGHSARLQYVRTLRQRWPIFLPFFSQHPKSSLQHTIPTPFHLPTGQTQSREPHLRNPPRSQFPPLLTNLSSPFSYALLAHATYSSHSCCHHPNVSRNWNFTCPRKASLPSSGPYCGTNMTRSRAENASKIRFTSQRSHPLADNQILSRNGSCNSFGIRTQSLDFSASSHQVWRFRVVLAASSELRT
jgi:hypothetical protein